MYNSLTSCQSKSTQPFISEAPLQTFDVLPDDTIVQIFKILSLSTLRQLSPVCKRFKLLTECDPLWQDFAHRLLFPNDLASKLPGTTYQDYCKMLLTFKHKINDLYQTENLKKTIEIHLRDFAFVDRLKQMKLSNYQLLTAPEIKTLIEQNDTQKMLFSVPTEHFHFHHVAQQTVGKVKFDFLNCTDHVISFDPDRKLMINNHLTARTFTEIDCQLIIFISDDYLHIYNSDIGDLTIVDINCIIEDLKQDNLLNIMWGRDAWSLAPVSITSVSLPDWEWDVQE
jgi:F-box associated protein